MSTEPTADDRRVLDRLKTQAQRLESLERLLDEIQLERDQLQSVTDRMSQQIKEYEQSKHEWDWFFEHSLDMLCIAGQDGYFKRVNPAFCDTLGYDAETLLSNPITSFVHPDDVEKTGQELECLLRGDDSINFENRYLDRSGQWRWLSWRCPATTSSTEHFYAIARDITKQKLHETEMLYRVRHDHLTGLLNRAAFEQELINAMGRVDRGLAGQVTVLLFDLDHFKPINDGHGHAAGDAVLKELGRRLQSIQRQHEFMGRLGGDEFAWLTETSQSTGEATPLAERLRETVRHPVRWHEGQLQVDCSIGIASYPQAAEDAYQLMVQADRALYAAKDGGRGGVRTARAKSASASLQRER